jgi:hypothetical protein
MSTAVTTGLLLAAVAVCAPAVVLLIETLAALATPGKSPRSRRGDQARAAVLVPAHDEAGVIARSLLELKKQLHSGDRLLVIADNCTDDTAGIARTCGAEVLVRNDPERRGKGYALDFGVQALAASPPDVVVIVDADCIVGFDALGSLVRTAAASGRPTQAAYTLAPPPGASPRQQLAGFAFVVKNLVRPRGLRWLGLPCLLTGSGMAFPWAVLRDAPLASGDIVEDMSLGVGLALAGVPPLFCPEARVTGEFPTGAGATASQRRRWEHGHLRTLLTQVPRLALGALRRRSPTLVGVALELSVPPLALLATATMAVLAGAGLFAALDGSPLPLAVAGAAAGALGLAVFVAWAGFGRDRLSALTLLAAPAYALVKLPLYLGFLVRPQRTWVRTDRGPVGGAHADR